MERRSRGYFLEKGKEIEANLTTFSFPVQAATEMSPLVDWSRCNAAGSSKVLYFIFDFLYSKSISGVCGLCDWNPEEEEEERWIVTTLDAGRAA